MFWWWLSGSGEGGWYWTGCIGSAEPPTYAGTEEVSSGIGKDESFGKPKGLPRAQEPDPPFWGFDSPFGKLKSFPRKTEIRFVI